MKEPFVKHPLGTRHDLRRSVALFALTAASLTTVFACSSRDEVLMFGAGTNDSGAPPPSFVEPDAASGATGDGGRLEPESLMCMTTECPPPFATCPSFGALPNYACSTDLSSDPANCGACGNTCGAGASAHHFKAGCTNGVCQPLCEAGYSDCNGIPDDGCESNPKTDPNNCGICGNQCPDGVACIGGTCGCPPGMTECNGTCVDLTSDDANCGTCGFACADHQPEDAGTVPPHMFHGCWEGQCKDLRCYRDSKVFWADCNQNVDADGCEVDLKKPNSEHCGQCGNQCAPGQQCFSTSDTGMDCQCKGSKHLCPATSGTGSCVDLDDDTKNCGSCGYVCPTITNADPACSQGRCGYICRPGFADCNGRSSDGCEVDLNSDPRNCGSCGNACDVGAGQPCAGGKCATTECDAGGGPIQ